MTISLSEYNNLKRQVSSLQNQIAKAEGGLEELEEQLAEIGCESLDEAVAFLKELETKQARLEKKYRKLNTAFEEKYGDQLS